jgi:hypothetical protein
MNLLQLNTISIIYPIMNIPQPMDAAGEYLPPPREGGIDINMLLAWIVLVFLDSD